jgi:defect-in-organelle-trafficking protein DotA
VFAFGALGWIISVIEAMVAGPLVALQVLVPSEHQGPFGKAEGALMMLFEIFLRPTLMIFGMMAAMLLATVAIKMVNAGFGIVFNSFGKATWSTGDPIFFFMMMGAYVMLVLAVLNKCFALINVVPQQVMGWIGGKGVEVGAPTDQVKGGIEAVGSRAGGALGRETPKGVGEKGRELRTEQAKDEKNKKDKKGTEGKG